MARPTDKQVEFRIFLIITLVLFPILSIVVVGGYGFIVWISQLILGPPTI